MSNEPANTETVGSFPSASPDASKKRDTAQAVASFLETLLNYSARGGRRVSITADFVPDETALRSGGVVVKSSVAAGEASRSMVASVSGGDVGIKSVDDVEGGVETALSDIVEFAINRMDVPEAVQETARGAVGPWLTTLGANDDAVLAYAIVLTDETGAESIPNDAWCDRVIVGTSGVLTIHAALS